MFIFNILYIIEIKFSKIQNVIGYEELKYINQRRHSNRLINFIRKKYQDILVHIFSWNSNISSIDDYVDILFIMIRLDDYDFYDYKK